MTASTVKKMHPMVVQGAGAEKPTQEWYEETVTDSNWARATLCKGWWISLHQYNALEDRLTKYLEPMDPVKNYSAWNFKCTATWVKFDHVYKGLQKEFEYLRSLETDATPAIWTCNALCGLIRRRAGEIKDNPAILHTPVMKRYKRTGSPIKAPSSPKKKKPPTLDRCYVLVRSLPGAEKEGQAVDMRFGVMDIVEGRALDDEGQVDLAAVRIGLLKQQALKNGKGDEVPCNVFVHDRDGEEGTEMKEVTQDKEVAEYLVGEHSRREGVIEFFVRV